MQFNNFTFSPGQISPDITDDSMHDGQNSDAGNTNKIFYNSYKEHPEISKTAKLGTEIFQNMENIALL